jgi:hypothetical protein
MEHELLTAPELLSSFPVLSGGRVAQFFVFCVVFCRSLFALLSFFCWSVYFLSFFDLRIIPLVSSNYSYQLARAKKHQSEV